MKKSKFNFLFIVVDDLRYPVCYENEEIKRWRRKNLKGYEGLKKNGLEFKNHYVASLGTGPSKATLYTGHYSQLHGVNKSAGYSLKSVSQLESNIVPTIGEYLKLEGYKTYFKGRWNMSDESIKIPKENKTLESFSIYSGTRDNYLERVYKSCNRLEKFGFD